jgi:hypothetical protein
MSDLKDFLENIRKFSPKIGEVAMRHVSGWSLFADYIFLCRNSNKLLLCCYFDANINIVAVSGTLFWCFSSFENNFNSVIIVFIFSCTKINLSAYVSTQSDCQIPTLLVLLESPDDLL